MFCQILNLLLLNSCVTLVSTTTVLMTIYSQGRFFGVLNYAPSKLTDSAMTQQLNLNLGLAMNFKARYRNHQTSFHHTKRNKKELSKQIWTLKDTKKPFKIKWKVLKRSQPYNVSKKCNLCLDEKFEIFFRKDLCSLSKGNE